MRDIDKECLPHPLPPAPQASWHGRRDITLGCGRRTSGDVPYHILGSRCGQIRNGDCRNPGVVARNIVTKQSQGRDEALWDHHGPAGLVMTCGHFLDNRAEEAVRLLEAALVLRQKMPNLNDFLKIVLDAVKE
jgi:hypothetical protein